MRLAALIILLIVTGVALIVAPLNIDRKPPSEVAKAITLIINGLCFSSAIYLYTH